MESSGRHSYSTSSLTRYLLFSLTSIFSMSTSVGTPASVNLISVSSSATASKRLTPRISWGTESLTSFSSFHWKDYESSSSVSICRNSFKGEEASPLRRHSRSA